MSLKGDYLQAYSALRWQGTYSPDWDYWYRKYPHFDERRKPNDELLCLSPLAVGMAQQSYILAFEYPYCRESLVAGRYLTRYENKLWEKKHNRTYVMVDPELWKHAEVLLQQEAKNG